MRNVEEELDVLIRLMKKHATGPEIASSVGRVLEFLLQECRYNFHLSVKPKRDEKYTIGDIWPKFVSNVIKTNPMKRIPTNFPDEGIVIVKEIESLNYIRNAIGAHYNQSELEGISRDEIIDFSTKVLDLFELLYCKTCGQFIYHDEGSKSTSCKRNCLKYEMNSDS